MERESKEERERERERVKKRESARKKPPFNLLIQARPIGNWWWGRRRERKEKHAKKRRLLYTRTIEREREIEREIEREREAHALPKVQLICLGKVWGLLFKKKNINYHKHKKIVEQRTRIFGTLTLRTLKPFVTTRKKRPRVHCSNE